jgi:signal transduction histidine kinase
MYDASQIVLNVTDQGKGMPKAHFDRFLSSGTAGGVGLAGMRERINEVSGDLVLARMLKELM